MPYPITLFTGQFADLSLEEVAERASSWGYQGLELACWGGHFDVDSALGDPAYCKRVRDVLDTFGLSCRAISTHFVSQAVCDDPIDSRHHGVLPESIWGDGAAEGVRRRAEEEVKRTARAAAAFGASVVVGFTGSSIFHMFAGWPPLPEGAIERGFEDFRVRWSRIMDVYRAEGIKYACEVHPGEIAYDYWTTSRMLVEMREYPEYGINFDPSHLHWQGIDEAGFVRDFGDRIYHVHCKDAIKHLDGRNGILGSHLPSGAARRGWDFVSVGHGGVPFEAIIRNLHEIGYQGDLSVEWEDSGMARDQGAEESRTYIQRLNFEPSAVSWEEALTQGR
jgi:sugar phosphate isomerase/epimerase